MIGYFSRVGCCTGAGTLFEAYLPANSDRQFLFEPSLHLKGGRCGPLIHLSYEIASDFSVSDP
jgi:hypothetical protein